MVSAASNRTLLVAGFTMLAFGTMLVLVKDWQVSLGFNQPYLWTTGTFFGQSFLLPVYYCTGRRASDRGKGSEQTKPPAPLHAYALVTSFEFGFSCLINQAYAGLPGSICQMLKGLKLVFTFLLSSIVLGKSLRSHQCLGVSLTVAGLTLVGVATTYGEGTGWASTHDAFVSLNLGIASCLVGAMQFIWEEKTMKQYAVEPELLTGMEGIIGVAYGIIVLASADVLGMVDVPGALTEMWHRNVVLFSFVLILASQAMFGFTALVVTTNSSAMVRSLLDVARSCGIWAIEVYCGWERFLWVELVGFVIMVLGMMIYGKNLVVPCLAYEEEGPLLPVKQDETQK